MKKTSSVRQITFCGLFAAGMALCAWLYIPFGPIGFTLQTFSLYLALFTLGGKWGSAAFFVYLFMGAVGLPVFSGFRGGIGMLFGATGGYIWGLALAGPVYWILTRMFGQQAAILSAFLGILLCYLCGTLWFFMVYSENTGLWAVLLNCVVPYVLPDFIKILFAYTLSKRLRAVIEKS